MIDTDIDDVSAELDTKLKPSITPAQNSGVNSTPIISSSLRAKVKRAVLAVSSYSTWPRFKSIPTDKMILPSPFKLALNGTPPPAGRVVEKTSSAPDKPANSITI